MISNPSFSSMLLEDKLLYNHGNTTLLGVDGRRTIEFRMGTYFVYVYMGAANWNGDNVLKRGMYGCFTDGYMIFGEGTRAIIIHTVGYNGLTHIGGAIEKRGRLRYIDGCTDTLLIPPVKLGDPCLNYLHFPTATRQTQHTHPSDRIGIVVRGQGFCDTPFGSSPMWAGQVFIIHPETGAKALGKDNHYHRVGLHSFRTDVDELAIVAFHPDSDWGATDEDHPMLNRTYVDGVSMRGYAGA